MPNFRVLKFSRKPQPEADGFDGVDVEIPILSGKATVVIWIYGIIEISDIRIVTVEDIEDFRCEAQVFVNFIAKGSGD